MLLQLAHALVHDVLPDWHELADDGRLLQESEASQLSPLLRATLHNRRAIVAPVFLRQLDAVMLRQAARHRVLTSATSEILDCLERLTIDAAVLKGAALAWRIYPAPELRPMADIDILVPARMARSAQDLLRSLGFRAPARHRRFGRNAHHLVPASRVDGGLQITVEIHTDALTRDVPYSIAFGNLTEPLQWFLHDRVRRATLGHVDTIRHLAHHLLEPSTNGFVRLIGVIDLLRYARIYHDDIDWDMIGGRFPLVANVISCTDHVVPLPNVLRRYAAASSRAPVGAGEIMRPLTEVLETRRIGRATFTELFDPPAWWLHAYYGVPPGRSLWIARSVCHPLRVARWFLVRWAGY